MAEELLPESFPPELPNCCDFGFGFEFRPRPSELISILDEYNKDEPFNFAGLPVGFHDKDVYTLTLDQILGLRAAEDGNWYFISPLKWRKRPDRNRTTPEGSWVSQTGKKAKENWSEEQLYFRSRIGPRYSEWKMYEYTLHREDARHCLCVVHHDNQGARADDASSSTSSDIPTYYPRSSSPDTQPIILNDED